MKNVAVLDTSVILHDANSIFGFDGYDIIIPLVVLNEVDKFRSLDNEVGRNARSFIRSLSKLYGVSGKLARGVERKETGEQLYVKMGGCSDFTGLDAEVASVLDLKSNDDKILAFCLGLIKEKKPITFKLITKDISLAAKANVIDIPCEDYQTDSQVREPSQLFTGMAELVIPGHLIDRLHRIGSFPFMDIDPEYISSFEAYENMGVTLIDEYNTSHTSLCVYKEGVLNKFNYTGGAICGITPQNREQMLAFELMFNYDIPLVTLTGKAGVGKTLLAIAASIDMAIDNNMYDRLLVSRPIQPLGKDIGYLPGNWQEKVDPYMGPIKDAVEFVFGGKREKMVDLMGLGMLEIEPLTYIRGRSLPRTLFLLDESQNLSRHEMKTIVSRMGKGSKLILTGDVHQIDNHYLDATTNGLTNVVEKFKSYDVAGHITLMKGQRSRLATLAADIL